MPGTTGTTTSPLHPSASLARAVSDAALAAAWAAHAQLEGGGHRKPGRAARTHQARKLLKQVRALARLWRGAVPDAERREVDRQARDLGRALSEAREATVLRETAAGLGLDPDRLGLADAARAPWRPETRAALVQQAEALAQRIQAVAPDQGGFDLLAPGLSHTWREGRRGLRAARPDAHAEQMHEWRKVVKARMLQERLLVPAWPEVLGPTVAALDELQELLGDHHDLHVLAEYLKTLQVQSQDELSDRIAQRQQALATRAFHLGDRLYAGQAEGWSGLLGGWVHAWWSESTPHA